MSGERAEGQQSRAQREAELRDEQDASPVEPVRDRAATQRPDDQRHRLHDAEKTDVERRPRQ